MWKKAGQLIFSTRLTAVLLLIFALAMAVGTFVENDHGTPAAKALIYQAPWFEWLMILMAINFSGNISRYRLWRREKWPVLMFHVGFLIILAGAAITRYTGYEGIMRIREGQASNILISDQSYFRITASDGDKGVYREGALRLSPLSSNRFETDVTLGDQKILAQSVEFVPSAVQEIQSGSGDKEILNIVVAGQQGRQEIPLVAGKGMTIDGISIAFNYQESADINITSKDGRLLVASAEPLDYMVMADQRTGRIPADSLSDMPLRTLYQRGEFSFVPAELYSNAELKWVTVPDKERADMTDDALVVDVSSGGQTERVVLRGGQGYVSEPTRLEFGYTTVEVAFGPKPIQLPFSLFLNDFQLERYPGSNSPSAYASEVTVMDGPDEIPYRIFMNNVLDHKGYRFFQASYDTDERGTVLSVNHDFWGTQVTYLGYLVMSLGMLWTLFGKGSYFTQLSRRLRQIESKKAALTSLMIGVFLTAYADAESPTADEILARLQAQSIPVEHAEAFGRLLVQDLDGRIKPVNSLSSEFLRKVAHRPYYRYRYDGQEVRLSSDQAFMSMVAYPQSWQHIPVIYVHPRKGKAIQELIGGANEDNYATFSDFIDDSGAYILQEDVARATQKKPSARNEYDKEILRVDERFNILYNVFMANYLRIFPLKNEINNTWYSPVDPDSGFRGEDSLFVHSILSVYFESMDSARLTNDWSTPEEYLGYIAKYQEVTGGAVFPEKGRIEGELLYNRLNLFFWLFQYYWTIGPILLILALARVFSASRVLRISWNAGVGIAAVGFLLHGFNLGLRWYVSGHAPWSNGYEMLIFVAWSLVLFGFWFTRRSRFTLPLALTFAGALLFVSYLDWLNPEITNLVPVLKSYWLKIHVATIVSSYAPLALACLLGFLALNLMIFRNRSNADRIDLAIDEVTTISQMAMTIGLFLLSIGTFLGGVWANESWGRYWGWDPKETWALISIIVYATVLHMRLIPGLRGKYAINLASVLAFSSIVMTSFGVNYYLAGLHSYAKGDPVPIPEFTYWVIAIVGIVAVGSYLRFRRPLQESTS